MSLVLDSSATFAFIYSDETTEPIRRVFDAVANEGAMVPALWRLADLLELLEEMPRSHRRVIEFVRNLLHSRPSTDAGECAAAPDQSLRTLQPRRRADPRGDARFAISFFY